MVRVCVLWMGGGVNVRSVAFRVLRVYCVHMCVSVTCNRKLRVFVENYVGAKFRNSLFLFAGGAEWTFYNT